MYGRLEERSGGRRRGSGRGLACSAVSGASSALCERKTMLYMYIHVHPLYECSREDVHVPGVQSPHSVRDDTDIGLAGRTPCHSAVTLSLHDTLVMAAHVTMREGSVGMR